MLQPALTASHLLNAIQTAQAGQFRKSLVAIRSAKALEPSNVHILALEKQLIRLSEFTDVGALSKEEQEESFELLRILADRAKENLRDHLYSLDQLIMGSDLSRVPLLSGTQRQATREVLTRQYLLRANQCLARNDPEGALLELHRIYVIDPVHREARQLEATIAARQAVSAATFHPPPETTEETTAPETQFAETAIDDLPGTAPSSESQAPVRLQREDEESPTRNPRRPLLTARALKKSLRILAGVGVIGSVMFLVLSKNRDDRDLMKESLGRLGDTESELRTAAVPSAERSSHPSQQKAPVEATNKDQGALADVATRRPEGLTDPGPGEPTPIPQIPEPSRQKRANPLRERASASGGLTEESDPAGTARLKETPVRVAGSVIRSEPQLTRLASFDFPDGMRQDGIEAEVVVQVQISPDGKPLQVGILSSSDPRLNQAVAETIMKSEFSPGKLQGNPVTAWVTLPLRFKE